MLITFYSLVVLMDLGLNPASKQARKMIDRVDKKLVFKCHTTGGSHQRAVARAWRAPG